MGGWSSTKEEDGGDELEEYAGDMGVAGENKEQNSEDYDDEEDYGGEDYEDEDCEDEDYEDDFG
jgi:hypothetical protein